MEETTCPITGEKNAFFNEEADFYRYTRPSKVIYSVIITRKPLLEMIYKKKLVFFDKK